VKPQATLVFALLTVLALAFPAFSPAAEEAYDFLAAIASPLAPGGDAAPGSSPVAKNSCYGQCVQEQFNLNCSHLDPAFQQACYMWIEEGCRCGCGLYCP